MVSTYGRFWVSPEDYGVGEYTKAAYGQRRTLFDLISASISSGFPALEVTFAPVTRRGYGDFYGYAAQKMVESESKVIARKRS